MLQNAVVLYRSTITFSYTVSTNHKSWLLRIPLTFGEDGPVSFGAKDVYFKLDQWLEKDNDNKGLEYACSMLDVNATAFLSAGGSGSPSGIDMVRRRCRLNTSG